MLNIRRAEPCDQDVIWKIFHEVVSAGNTYAFATDLSRDEALSQWMKKPHRCYVAEEEGTVVGTYYIKLNQPKLGAHVCNVGYMVATHARGAGIGHALCKHSVNEARQLGYKAMQYNLVVSTNEGAITLWKKMGFEIVGTLPRAFNHGQMGLVDAYVMYQWLGDA